MMKSLSLTVLTASFLITSGFSQDAIEEDVFEYTVGEVDYLTGEGFNVGGFLVPEIFFIGTGGVTEPGSDVGDFANSEHDPQNDVTVQAIDVDLILNFNDVVTGFIAGTGFQIEDSVWEAELEEAFLHFNITDNLAIGGGQFLNTFGFQAHQHVHGWDMVNQNLINSRMLNEGHLFTQGGEVLFKTPNSGLLSLALGGVRSHAHDHGHDDHDDHDEHEEEHHDEHEDEHDHHFESHDAGFNDWVLSADYKFRLPFDDSVVLSTSLATGENGFGGDTHLYGVGLQKVWNGHDHGAGGPDFCTGALMFRTEFFGREVEAIHEDGDVENFDDYGLSSLLSYGLSDATTISFRHDWVSDVEELELSDTHRFSPSITTYVDPAQRIKLRLQYDNVQSASLESEHVAWLQVQFQWGGDGGSHANHNH
ncbi:MAG: hypothetical protein P1U68_14165 [Verrucomicrobiales bacterium]|nr:hypothetical protein [Verrucomicrobiales bacterium]